MLGFGLRFFRALGLNPGTQALNRSPCGSVPKNSCASITEALFGMGLSVEDTAIQYEELYGCIQKYVCMCKIV